MCHVSCVSVYVMHGKVGIMIQNVVGAMCYGARCDVHVIHMLQHDAGQAGIMTMVSMYVMSCAMRAMVHGM